MLVIGMTACAGDGPSVATQTADPSPTQADSASESADGALYPEVVDATLTRDGDGTWTAAVTISSPYDSPEQYADAWRLLTPDREELAVRVLAHPHADEQPFTRSQSGIEIPEHVDQVIVQGRDLVNGWGGTELTVEVPR